MKHCLPLVKEIKPASRMPLTASPSFSTCLCSIFNIRPIPLSHTLFCTVKRYLHGLIILFTNAGQVQRCLWQFRSVRNVHALYFIWHQVLHILSLPDRDYQKLHRQNKHGYETFQQILLSSASKSVINSSVLYNTKFISNNYFP